MTDEKAIEVYNKLNFLFSIMIPLLDLAEETCGLKKFLYICDSIDGSQRLIRLKKFN